MIRETSFQPQKRRIAVVKVNRPQQARMGSVGSAPQARTSVISWSPTAPAPPDSSANWMSSVLQAQDQARMTTPGTFSYTPASTTPAPNVAPWNSWLQPNCDNGPTPANAGVDPGATPPDSGWFWKALGLLGGAAASVYLVRSITEKERR